MASVIETIPDNSGGTWGSSRPNPSGSWGSMQTFTVSGSSKNLDSAAFVIQNNGTGTGTFFYAVYALTGTPGSNATPTGGAIAVTNSRTWNTVNQSFANLTMSFTTNPTLTVGTYGLVIQSTSGSGGNYFLRLGSGIAGKNLADKFGAGAWTPDNYSVYPATIYAQDITSTKTQTGVSRIQLSFFPTQTGKSSITSVNPYPQLGTARVTASTLRTQTGLSRLGKTASADQTGRSRISQVVSGTVTGKSRITVSATPTITGKANIQQQNSRIIQGTASVVPYSVPVITYALQMYYGGIGYGMVPGVYSNDYQTQRAVDGVARIEVSTTANQTGLSRITAKAQGDQTGVARIEKVVVRVISGTSRIEVSTSKSQTGKSRITALQARNQLGVANIRNNTTRDTYGKALILQGLVPSAGEPGSQYESRRGYLGGYQSSTSTESGSYESGTESLES